MKPLLLPPRLKKGDCIGLVTPASPVHDAVRIERGVRYLESLGYCVSVGKNVGRVSGYLAGTDEQRVADLHEMFDDRNIKAIFCIRGGYGTPRLLSLLNYRLIARNPKILSGFSDVTALQLAIWRKCRLVTFHGLMAGVEMANEIDPFTEEMFWRCVTSTKKLGTIPLHDSNDIEALLDGKATGHLLGGNLSLIVSLLGTPYQPDFADTILFIEEVAEEPYRIDRMMTHLYHASILKRANGMLLGQFSDCVPSDTSKPSLTTNDVLRNAASLFAKPALLNLPFGHVARKITLPVGLRVRLNAKAKSIEFLEAAVQ